MKRITAAKRIKAHLRDYRKRLNRGRLAKLAPYKERDDKPCPLCRACGETDFSTADCYECLGWPALPVQGDSYDPSCINFIRAVNSGPFASVIPLLDKLEAELDRWASEEKS